MDFAFAEDQGYFTEVLCDGDASALQRRCQNLFDFRDPLLKRREFDRCKQEIRDRHLRRYGPHCMLRYPGICKNSPLVLDHFIPLSSNTLNKLLRKLWAKPGRKVPTQSFGSNHPDNLVLACQRCNAYKKQRVPDRALVLRVIAAKRGEHPALHDRP